MSRNYSVTEPHPSVAKSGYISSSRGGAGNIRQYKSEDITKGPNATGPASRIKLTRGVKPSNPMTIGRGGAGNMFKPAETEERVFQFDEEMSKRRDSQAPVYHIGRGGAANYVDEREGESRRRTNRLDSSASSDSVNSTDSAASDVRRSVGGAISKITRRFS